MNRQEFRRAIDQVALAEAKRLVDSGSTDMADIEVCALRAAPRVLALLQQAERGPAPVPDVYVGFTLGALFMLLLFDNVATVVGKTETETH